MTGRNFEHRKGWIRERLHLLAGCFAAAIHAYAIMSNHLHLVLQVDCASSLTWSDEVIASRWVRLFPPCEDFDIARELKRRSLLAIGAYSTTAYEWNGLGIAPVGTSTPALTIGVPYPAAPNWSAKADDTLVRLAKIVEKFRTSSEIIFLDNFQ